MVRVILNSIKMVKHEMKVLGDEKYGDEYQNECKELKEYYDQLLKKDVISQLSELPDDYKKMVEQVYYEGLGFFVEGDSIPHDIHIQHYTSVVDLLIEVVFIPYEVGYRIFRKVFLIESSTSTSLLL